MWCDVSTLVSAGYKVYKGDWRLYSNVTETDNIMKAIGHDAIVMWAELTLSSKLLKPGSHQ